MIFSGSSVAYVLPTDFTRGVSMRKRHTDDHDGRHEVPQDTLLRTSERIDKKVEFLTRFNCLLLRLI